MCGGPRRGRGRGRVCLRSSPSYSNKREVRGVLFETVLMLDVTGFSDCMSSDMLVLEACGWSVDSSWTES